MLQEFRDTENLKENFDQNKRMRQVIEIIRNQDFWFDFFLKKIITTCHTLEHFYNALPPLINSSFVPYKIHSVRRVYLTFFPLPPSFPSSFFSSFSNIMSFSLSFSLSCSKNTKNKPFAIRKKLPPLTAQLINY